MAITVNGTVTKGSNSTASSVTAISAVVSIPANANSDLTGLMVLIAVAFGNVNSPGISAPSGWTQVFNAATATAANAQIAVFTKTPSGSEPTSINVTTSNLTSQARSIGAAIWLLDGVDSVAPVTDTSHSDTSTSSASRATGGVTAPSGENTDAILTLWGMQSASTLSVNTAPSSASSDFTIQRSTTGLGVNIAGYHRILATSGTISSTLTWSGAAVGCEAAVLLKAGPTTTNISTTGTALWNVLSNISTSRTALWKVLASVSTSRTALWKVLQKVTPTRTVLWNVRQGVSTTRTAKWNVRKSISTTRTVLWNVASALVNISLSRTAKWNIRQSIPTSRTAKWNVRSLVQLARTALWKDYAKLTMTRTAKWNIQALSLFTMPAQEYVDAIHGPVTMVTRRVDIYEADGTTLWQGNVPFTTGAVTVDQTRDERRAFDLTISNIDGTFTLAPGQLWYDKVFKIYRGVKLVDGTVWETQIGEFLADKMTKDRSTLIPISGRDYTKRMLTSKFVADTNFVAPIPLEVLVRDIAENAGITKFNLPVTGQSTAQDFSYARGDARWKAVSDICTAYNWEIFFSADGTLTMRRFTDPTTSEIDYTFQTGPASNVANFQKSIDDSELYNHVVVTGASPAEGFPPVYAEALNTNASSPTSIAEIGDRVYEYTSEFITTVDQAQAVANQFLSIHALEQFDCTIDSVVIPYMDVGITVEFLDPNPAPGDPTRYLMSSFSIPLTLSPMSADVKRITIVGA